MKNLRQYFRTIVTGNDVATSKPDPEIYRIALRNLGIAPDSAPAVEPSFSGVLETKAAGLCCVTILSESADLEISGFRQLKRNDTERCLRSERCA